MAGDIEACLCGCVWSLQEPPVPDDTPYTQAACSCCLCLSAVQTLVTRPCPEGRVPNKAPSQEAA
jgi:hypothetical protein